MINYDSGDNHNGSMIIMLVMMIMMIMLKMMKDVYNVRHYTKPFPIACFFGCRFCQDIFVSRLIDFAILCDGDPQNASIELLRRSDPFGQSEGSRWYEGRPLEVRPLGWRTLGDASDQFGNVWEWLGHLKAQWNSNILFVHVCPWSLGIWLSARSSSVSRGMFDDEGPRW